MWVWIDRVGPTLFDAALSTAIFLSAIVLAMLVFRQPSRRLLIARVALLASLLMIPLVGLAPLPRLDLVNTFFQSNLFHPGRTANLDGMDRAVSRAPLPDFAADWPIPEEYQDGFALAFQWLPRGLTLIDLAFVCAGCAWLLLGFWGVNWLVRHSREPSVSTRALFEHLTASNANDRARPSLRVSSRVQRPVVVGVVHPTILIPQSYEEPGDNGESLRLSLLHEIAHAGQFDPWFGVVASLAQTIWFFLPQTWWIRSQLLIDQEFLADRAASLRYGTSSAYAASLLSLAESGSSSVTEPRLDARAANGQPAEQESDHSPLFQRMVMLLHCPFRVEPCAPRSWSWMWRMAVIAASILAACLCVRWPYALAREYRENGGAAPAGQPFCVADFVAEPLVFLPGGRALPYVLPVALPLHFELTVDVYASAANLGKIYVAGHPIGSNQRAPAPVEHPSDRTESWHQVRLERHGYQLSMWIDGRKSSAMMNPQATSEWLTFEPDPDRATRFRNLVVNW